MGYYNNYDAIMFYLKKYKLHIMIKFIAFVIPLCILAFFVHKSNYANPFFGLLFTISILANIFYIAHGLDTKTTIIDYFLLNKHVKNILNGNNLVLVKEGLMYFGYKRKLYHKHLAKALGWRKHESCSYYFINDLLNNIKILEDRSINEFTVNKSKDIKEMT